MAQRQRELADTGKVTAVASANDAQTQVFSQTMLHSLVAEQLAEKVAQANARLGKNHLGGGSTALLPQAQAQAAHDRPSAQDHGHDADILADWLQAHGLALVDQPTTMIRLAARRSDTDAPAGNGPQNAPQARTATVCALAAQALG